MQQPTHDDFRPVTETGQTGSADIFALADRLRKMKDRKSALAEQTKATNADIEKIEDTLAQRMIDEELPRFSRGGKTFHLFPELYVSTKAGEAVTVQTWLIDHGYGDLVGKTVSASRLKSWVKEQLDESDDEETALPEGIRDLLNIYQRTTVRLKASD